MEGKPLQRSVSNNCIFRKVVHNKSISKVRTPINEDSTPKTKPIFKLGNSRKVLNSAQLKFTCPDMTKKSEPDSRVTPLNMTRMRSDKSCLSYCSNLSRSRCRDKSTSAKNEKAKGSKKIIKLGLLSLAKVMRRGKTCEDFIKFLQRSNGFFSKVETVSKFKYYVAPGNNSELVVDVLKRRSKWKRIYCFKRAHFIWTPWLSYNVLNVLPCFSATGEVSVNKVEVEENNVVNQEMAFEISPQQELDLPKVKVYNKLPGNHELAWKKYLFQNMYNYYKKKDIDPFTRIPLTYHIKVGSYDSAFRTFYAKFIELQRSEQVNIWIVKPGENTNRGFGIKVCSKIEEIIDAVNEFSEEYGRTFIVQKYIDSPLLYVGRKFDIRCYALVTGFQGNIQAYFYRDGYVRTCAEKYNLKNVKNNFIHLTNDAIQKFAVGYGKFENANKLSYAMLQEYLETVDKNINFFNDILPPIKQIVLDTIIATYEKLNPTKKIQCFEVLGYDFMIDSAYRPWLIEVNTNPCLELVSPYLEVLIPKMLENAFALTIDQFFFGNSYLRNEFEFIFSESLEGQFR